MAGLLEHLDEPVELGLINYLRNRFIYIIFKTH